MTYFKFKQLDFHHHRKYNAVPINMFSSLAILTISNSRRTIFSDSPRHFDVRLAAEQLKKVVPHSVATPLASKVFPVPGGPIMHTP